MRLAALGAILLVLAGTTTSLQAQSSDAPLHLTATAVNDLAAGNDPVPVDIDIRRWTTVDTRARLIDTLLGGGSGALFAILQRALSHGNLSISQSSATDGASHVHPLQYAWKVHQPDGGLRIVVVTDRAVGWEDAKRQARAMAYPFALFEIHISPDGHGEGRLAVVSEISCDKDAKRIEIERYGAEAVRLADVRIRN